MPDDRNYNYASAKGVTQQEFLQNTIRFDEREGTLTPPEDIEKIEDVLLLRRGVLSGEKMWVNKQSCKKCGRAPTFYDIVKTAVDHSHHSISLMAHTLAGNKYIINQPRTALCAQCSEPLDLICTYDNSRYGCSWNVNK